MAAMDSFESIARVLYARKAQKPPPSRRRASIMIIDDNVEVIEALRQVLGRRYAVVGCCSCMEAESRLSEEIKVVLLDVKMSPVDGFGAFARLKQRYPAIRVIFNTAHPGDSAAVARLRDLESDGCLTKGEYSEAELERVIEQAISRTGASGQPAPGALDADS
jgi:CheY-like chemotaxis protein